MNCPTQWGRQCVGAFFRMAVLLAQRTNHQHVVQPLGVQHVDKLEHPTPC